MTILLALAQNGEAARLVTQAAEAVPPNLPPFSVGKVFTFLFLTLGPIKIIAPYLELTRGRDAAFRRALALRATLYSAIGLLLAATLGASTLRSWGISTGALQLTAGLVLVLVALKPVLEQYAPQRAANELPESPPDGSTGEVAKLAMSPLAFPTIVTPWGVAVLILLVTLRGSQQSAAVQIFSVTAAILLIDLLAMLFAERILKAPVVRTTFGIFALVLAILQVALGVQAMVGALPMLGLAAPVTAEARTVTAPGALQSPHQHPNPFNETFPEFSPLELSVGSARVIPIAVPRPTRSTAHALGTGERAFPSSTIVRRTTAPGEIVQLARARFVRRNASQARLSRLLGLGLSGESSPFACNTRRG